MHGSITLWRFSPCSCILPTTAVILTFRLLGCFTTLLIPETKRKTLEQLSGMFFFVCNLIVQVRALTPTDRVFWRFLEVTVTQRNPTLSRSRAWRFDS